MFWSIFCIFVPLFWVTHKKRVSNWCTKGVGSTTSLQNNFNSVWNSVGGMKTILWKEEFWRYTVSQRCTFGLRSGDCEGHSSFYTHQTVRWHLMPCEEVLFLQKRCKRSHRAPFFVSVLWTPQQELRQVHYTMIRILDISSLTSN